LIRDNHKGLLLVSGVIDPERKHFYLRTIRDCCWSVVLSILPVLAVHMVVLWLSNRTESIELAVVLGATVVIDLPYV
jgi:uncharacterized protein (DUF2384 family)